MSPAPARTPTDAQAPAGSLRIEEVRGGARVVETSNDPQATLLIRQHARRAVSEFVRFGMVRAMRATPLPPGYEG